MTWWAARVLVSKVGDGEIDNYLGHLATNVDMVSLGGHMSLPRQVAGGPTTLGVGRAEKVRQVSRILKRVGLMVGGHPLGLWGLVRNETLQSEVGLGASCPIAGAR